MDLQIKLVNDGYAATCVSQEAARLSDWAHWKDQAWGVTAEPIVIVYNKRLIPPDQVPTSHHALRRYLETDQPIQRRVVATYDPSRPAVGYLHLSQDEQASSEIWRLVQAMNRGRVDLYSVNRRLKGTPYRRAIGTPLRFGMDATSAPLARGGA